MEEVIKYLLQNIPFYYTIDRLRNGFEEDGLQYKPIDVDMMTMKQAQDYVKNDEYVKMLKERDVVITAILDHPNSGWYSYHTVISGFTAGEMIRPPLYREGMTLDDVDNKVLTDQLDQYKEEEYAIVYLYKNIPFYTIRQYVIGEFGENWGGTYGPFRPLYFPGITLDDAKNIANSTYSPESDEYINTLKERKLVVEYLANNDFYKRTPYQKDMTVEKLELKKEKISILSRISFYDANSNGAIHNVMNGFDLYGVAYPSIYNDGMTVMDCHYIRALFLNAAETDSKLPSSYQKFKIFCQQYIDLNNRYELFQNIHVLLNLFKIDEINITRFGDLTDAKNIEFKNHLIDYLKNVAYRTDNKEIKGSELKEIIDMYFGDRTFQYKYKIYQTILNLSFDPLIYNMVTILGKDTLRTHMIKRQPHSRGAPLHGGVYTLNKQMYIELN